MIALDRVIAFLVLAFPIVLLAVKPLAIMIFMFIAIIGVFVSIKDRKNPFAIESIKLFSWLTIGYFFVMSLSVLLSTEPTNSWVHLSRVSYFLFAPFVALAIIQSNISIEALVKSFKLGIVIAGAISLIGFIMADGSGRFSGMYNPNTFGDLAVMMLFFSILNIQNESQKEYMFSLVSVLFGVTAVCMTGSRGSMVSLILLLVVYILVMHRATNTNHRRIGLVAILFISTFSLNIFGFSDSGNRLFSIKTQIKKWEDSNRKLLDRANTTATRLEMYASGWKAFIDSPITGYGYYSCGVAASRYASQDELVQKDFEGRWHLHNELMTNMVNAGILGLGSLMALYIVPLLLFVRKIRSNTYAIMGVMLISGYVLLGLTHTLFGYEYETAFFIVILAYTLGQYSNESNKYV